MPVRDFVVPSRGWRNAARNYFKRTAVFSECPNSPQRGPSWDSTGSAVLPCFQLQWPNLENRSGRFEQTLDLFVP
jgi:hypothetical protein